MKLCGVSSSLLRVVMGLALVPVLSACVHEWPDDARPRRLVHVHVYYDPEPDYWDQHDMSVSRSEMPDFTDRYHFKVFDIDDDRFSYPLGEHDFVRGETQRDEFDTDLYLPAGDYAIYVWSDWAEPVAEKSYFFKTNDFSSIEYAGDYNGNNELRDAFRGEATVHIDDNLEADYSVSVSVPLERPLARYEFIATDLREFMDGEETRGMLTYVSVSGAPSDAPVKVPDLSKYRVKMIYTGYMPSKFNNFTNKPIDSSTGMSYDAEIRMIDEDNARLGFDYVMVNGSESSVAVALEVYDPAGELIARSNPINVATRRNRNTTVRGRFLTSKASGGVGINPDFDGDYNIEIK